MVLMRICNKLCNNRILAGLLRIKKSFKTINFDLAKHVLVFNVNYHWIYLK